MILAGIRTYLLSQSAVTDICGNEIYALRVPQREKIEDHLPAITIGRTSVTRDYDLDDSAGYVRASIRVDFWGQNYDQIEALAEAVRVSLLGYAGNLGTHTAEEIRLNDESDDYDFADDASDLGLFSISADYTVAFTETIPTHS